MSFILLAQNKNSENKLISDIEISGGKLYSPYRYFLFYNGYENINISIYHKFSDNLGLSFSQSYGRMLDDPKYNRGFLFSSTLNFSVDILKTNKYYITLCSGTGFEIIHLYNSRVDIYPIGRNLYGIPVRLKIANEDYYYKTWFLSTNIGIGYRF